MQDIREYLRSYRKTLKCAEQYLRDLDAMSYLRSPKMDGMPKTDSPHGLELVVEQRERLKKRAEKEREKAFRICDDIERRIDGLKSPTLRVIMHRHYIDGFEWSDVAALLDYSEANVHKLHRKALAELRKDWDEV